MHLPIVDPPDRAVARLLRGLVLQHGRAESRRVHDPVLHLAAGDAVGTHAVECRLGRREDVDDALLTDMAAALLRRLALPDGVPLIAWLTRIDDLEIQDADLAAYRAVRTALAEAEGPDFRFVVVNRRAWRDPVTGTGREWRRLRDRRLARQSAQS